MATSTTIRDSVLQVAVEDLVSHLATLEAELSLGRSIELLRGETVIAEMRAPKTEVAGLGSVAERPLPDFMGRMKAIWGDTVFPEGTGVRLVRADRDGDE